MFIPGGTDFSCCPVGPFTFCNHKHRWRTWAKHIDHFIVTQMRKYIYWESTFTGITFQSQQIRLEQDYYQDSDQFSLDLRISLSVIGLSSGYLVCMTYCDNTIFILMPAGCICPESNESHTFSWTTAAFVRAMIALDLAAFSGNGSRSAPDSFQSCASCNS